MECCVEFLFRGVGTRTTGDEELQGDTFLVNPHGWRTLSQGRRCCLGGCCSFKCV